MDWDARLRAVLDPVPAEFELAIGLRNAAVLAPWFTSGEAEQLLFTARPVTMAHHGGQVSFPGGKQENGESPLDCALREAHEELGIVPASVDVLGALSPLTSGAGFRVTTIVGRIRGVESLKPDSREIERVFEEPVLHLSKRQRWYDRVGEGGRRASPHYDLSGAVLWGLTARMTQELLRRLGLFES